MIYFTFKQVGEMGEERHRIFQVASLEMIPVQTKSRPAAIDPMLEEVQNESQSRCITLLQEVLSTPYFYYSPTADLTNSMQRLHKLGPFTQPYASQGKESWDRLDHRFVWNAHALSPFLEIKANSTDLHAFIMPLIHGAVFIKRCNINRVSSLDTEVIDRSNRLKIKIILCHMIPFLTNFIHKNIFNNQEQITWSILSRRSRYRTGTRFFVRGSDDVGNVANFCETEQILEKRSSGVSASYLQTRGSMPMKWTQTPNIYYKPKVMVE